MRSEAEILGTLDADGRLEGLPFMPEMLPHCGKRFRVSARAYKACDTIAWKQLRRMENAVHLEELRCDGAAHGGCQAAASSTGRTLGSNGSTRDARRCDGPDD